MDKGMEIIDPESIEQLIFVIRGQKVMLDRGLAVLYGVRTKVLNQAVKRNEKRFPPDFMFQITKEEKDELVTNCDRFQKLKHSTVLPRVFTEQGVAGEGQVFPLVPMLQRRNVYGTRLQKDVGAVSTEPIGPPSSLLGCVLGSCFKPYGIAGSLEIEVGGSGG